MLSRVRTRLSDVAASMDAASARLGHAVPLALWPALYAVTLGEGLFALRHLGDVPHLENNKLPEPETVQLAIWVGVTLAALRPRLRRDARRRPPPREAPRPPAAERRDGGRRGQPPPPPRARAPADPGAHAPEHRARQPEGDALPHRPRPAPSRASPCTGGSPRRAPRSPRRRGRETPPLRRRGRVASIAAAAALAAIWAAYGYFFSRISLNNHHALHTSIIDLGYYDNIFCQSAHGRPLACSFIKAGYHGSAHFDPLLVVLSPLHYLYPRAELLLVLQSVWLGAGVVPLYLIAHRRLESRLAAVALAAMYARVPGAARRQHVRVPLAHVAHAGRAHAPLLPRVRRGPRLLARARPHAPRAGGRLPPARASSAHTPSSPGGRVRLAAAGSRSPICLVYFAIVKRFFMTSSRHLQLGQGLVLVRLLLRGPHPQPQRGEGLPDLARDEPGLRPQDGAGRGEDPLFPHPLPAALLPPLLRPAGAADARLRSLLLPARDAHRGLLGPLPVLEPPHPDRLRAHAVRAPAGRGGALRPRCRARRGALLARAPRGRVRRQPPRVVEVRRHPRERNLPRRLRARRAVALRQGAADSTRGSGSRSTGSP